MQYPIFISGKSLDLYTKEEIIELFVRLARENIERGETIHELEEQIESLEEKISKVQRLLKEEK